MMTDIKNHEHDYFHTDGNIPVRREFVVEDAYDAIILGQRNPKSIFRIKFVNLDGGAEDGGGERGGDRQCVVKGRSWA